MKVLFNQAVDKVSAQTIGNYYVNDTAIASSGLFGGANTAAKLQDDNKTVIITLVSTKISNTTVATFKVDGVLFADYTKVPKFTSQVAGNDTAKPEIVSVTSEAGTAGTSSLVVKFSEPVHLGLSTATFSVDGQTATGSIDTNDRTKLNISAAQTLKSSTASYKLTLNNVGDGINTNTVLSKEFAVAAKSTVPTITSIAQKNNNIAVVLSEKVDNGNFAELVAGTDYSAYATGSASNYADAPQVDADDASGKTILFPVSSSVFTATSKTKTFEFTLKNIKDVFGNTIAKYTNTVTLTQDQTKAAFVKATLNASTNSDFIIEFSEPVQLPTVDLTVTNNKLGTITSIASANITESLVKADGTAVDSGVQASKYIKLTLASALDAETNYSLKIADDVILDVVGNRTKEFSFAASVGAASDSTKPTITSASASVVNGKNVIIVNFSEKVTIATATNANNYLLKGIALPAGTVLENASTNATDRNQVKITLPASSVDADVSAAALTVSGISDDAGNIIDTVSNNVALTDTKVQGIASAKITGTTTLLLTFNENVSLASSPGTITLTDGTTSIATTANSQNVSIVNKQATVTLSGSVAGLKLADVDVVITAGAFKDAAGNGIAAITADDDFRATDKLAAVTGTSITVTNTATIDTDKSDEISIRLTRGTNYDKDVVVSYTVYLVSHGTQAYNSLTALEASGLNSITTISAAQANATYQVAATKLSDGITALSDGTLISTLAGTGSDVDAYIITTDDAGNKAFFFNASAGTAIDVAD